jgi:hypothetical protein
MLVGMLLALGMLGLTGCNTWPPSWLGDLLTNSVPPVVTVTNALLPTAKSNERVYVDSTNWKKTSSIQKASCGLLLCTYHNISRKDSWVGLIGADGKHKVIVTTGNETIGTPSLADGWWTYAAESGAGKPLIKVKDATGEVGQGIPALATYATMCVDGYVAYSSPVRLVDPSGKVVHAWTDFSGFVAGLARRGDEWVIASMDGSATGIASTKGWRLSGAYPEVAVLNGEILGFAKNGDVDLVSNGKVVKTLFKTGRKANRARVAGGLVYWVTADYDSLWVGNGKDFKMLAEWKGGDSDNGIASGSGFNTSLTVDGDVVYVSRSVTDNGVEVWKVQLSGL